MRCSRPVILLAGCVALLVGSAVADTTCSVTDAKTGTVYDLSPLRKTTGNGVVEDARQENAYKYYINVCAPVNQQGTEVSRCAPCVCVCVVCVCVCLCRHCWGHVAVVSLPHVTLCECTQGDLTLLETG